jgi:hypothetical protein
VRGNGKCVRWMRRNQERKGEWVERGDPRILKSNLPIYCLRFPTPNEMFPSHFTSQSVSYQNDRESQKGERVSLERTV